MKQMDRKPNGVISCFAIFSVEKTFFFFAAEKYLYRKILVVNCFVFPNTYFTSPRTVEK